MAYGGTLPQLAEETEENQENITQSEWLVTQSRFEPGSFRIFTPAFTCQVSRRGNEVCDGSVSYSMTPGQFKSQTFPPTQSSHTATSEPEA
jgi:hypothetical protein